MTSPHERTTFSIISTSSHRHNLAAAPLQSPLPIHIHLKPNSPFPLYVSNICSPPSTHRTSPITTLLLQQKPQTPLPSSKPPPKPRNIKRSHNNNHYQPRKQEKKTQTPNNVRHLRISLLQLQAHHPPYNPFPSPVRPLPCVSPREVSSWIKVPIRWYEHCLELYPPPPGSSW